MKDNKKHFTLLDSLMASELQAINQSLILSEICENRGYSNLLMAMRMQALEEISPDLRPFESFIFYNDSTIDYKENTILPN